MSYDKNILSREAHSSGCAATLSPAGHFIARSAFILLLLLGGGGALMAQDAAWHAPGHTAAITFAAFHPAPNAPDLTTWTLTDSRDGKTYKVRKFADGNIWMVQDLRFGFCTGETFNNSRVAEGYAGHCRSNTQPGAGHLYDWTSVTSRVSAHTGICPEGWRVPTAEEYSTADALFREEYDCKSFTCWSAESLWAGVSTDFCMPTGIVQYHPGEIIHWTGSPYTEQTAYCFVTLPAAASVNLFLGRSYGAAVRCIKASYEL
jgi:uncharacterized protein (TIGR02145 family)